MNFTLSPNPISDSVDAHILLPFLIGYVNNYDSLISVEQFGITHDSSGSKYFYFRYLTSTSEIDDIVFKYYDPNDTIDCPGVTAAMATVRGIKYTCEGSCDSRCTMCIDGLDGTNPTNYLCQCNESSSSSTCQKVEVKISIGPNYKNSGLNMMPNININDFIFVPFIMEMP